MATYRVPLQSPAHRANCVWPIRRTSKGWARATLSPRFESALKIVVRTVAGQVLTVRSFGAGVDLYRNRPLSPEQADSLRRVVASGIEYWIPSIEVHDITVIDDSINRRRLVTVVWAIPGASEMPQLDPARSAAPITTTIQI